MIVLQGIGLCLWLVVIPFCMGLLLIQLLPKEERTPGTACLSGYLMSFALFELVGIPVVISVNYDGFAVLSSLFGITAAGLSLLGVLVFLKGRKAQPGFALFGRGRKESLFGKGYGREEKICFAIFFLMVAFQLYMAFTRASFDGDDAYYGVQGVVAQQIGSLYRINPNTGRSAPLDARHALALIPIWEAFVGKMSGVHATVIAHSIVPLVLIPLTYLMYFQIGRKLLKNRKDLLPMFLIVMALFQMFGNVSIYTNETFLLTRTWQGKAIAGNLILPAVFWVYLCLFDKERKKGEEKEENGFFLLLAFINLAGGACSSLAVLLSCLLTAGLGFLFMLKERRPGIFVKACLSCTAGAAYVLVYLMLIR